LIAPASHWSASGGHRGGGGVVFAGQPPATAQIVVGALVLLTRRMKIARVYAEID
jgi:hypothetical protein